MVGCRCVSDLDLFRRQKSSLHSRVASFSTFTCSLASNLAVSNASVHSYVDFSVGQG